MAAWGEKLCWSELRSEWEPVIAQHPFKNLAVKVKGRSRVVAGGRCKVQEHFFLS